MRRWDERNALAPLFLELADMPRFAARSLLLLLDGHHGHIRIPSEHRRWTDGPTQILRGIEAAVVEVGDLVQAGQRRHRPLLLRQHQLRVVIVIVVYHLRQVQIHRRHFSRDRSTPLITHDILRTIFEIENVEIANYYVYYYVYELLQLQSTAKRRNLKKIKNKKLKK